WTGKPHRLTSLVRIDGKAFRVMGKEPADVPALPQTNLEVLPTRTIYTFEGEGVRLTLTFMTPALPDDLDVLSRPVTYLTWEVVSADGKKHNMRFIAIASPEIAMDQPKGNIQLLTWGSTNKVKWFALGLGSKEQPVLAKKGDDTRIDWGYLYFVTPSRERTSDSRPNAIQEFITEQETWPLTQLGKNIIYGGDLP